MGINDTLSGTRPRIIIEWLDRYGRIHECFIFDKRGIFFFFFD